MTQTYLNSAQKVVLTKLFACYQFLDDLVTDSRALPDDVVPDLKRARTFAWRTAKSWLKRYDEKTHRSILNLIKDHEIGIMTRREAIKTRKEMDAMLSGKEYVERMTEVTWDAKCKTCDGSCQATCPLYESYRHFEVAEYDPSHPLCAYAGVGVEVMV